MCFRLGDVQIKWTKKRVLIELWEWALKGSKMPSFYVEYFFHVKIVKHLNFDNWKKN